MVISYGRVNGWPQAVYRAKTAQQEGKWPASASLHMHGGQLVVLWKMVPKIQAALKRDASAVHSIGCWASCLHDRQTAAGYAGSVASAVYIRQALKAFAAKPSGKNGAVAGGMVQCLKRLPTGSLSMAEYAMMANSAMRCCSTCLLNAQ